MFVFVAGFTRADSSLLCALHDNLKARKGKRCMSPAGRAQQMDRIAGRVSGGCTQPGRFKATSSRVKEEERRFGTGTTESQNASCRRPALD